MSKNQDLKNAMSPIERHLPATLIYGSDCIGDVGELAARYEQKVMIVTYNRGTVLDSVIDQVESLLIDAGLSVVVFAAVESNQNTKNIDNAIALFNQENCDLVVALGGGSVIDSAKFIAVAAYSGGMSWDYAVLGEHTEDNKVSSAFPIIAIPTLSATGSEANTYAGIENFSTKEKRFFSSPCCLPKLLIVDTELLISASQRLTQDNCITIFANLIEHYLSSNEESDFADRVTEGMILCLKDNFDKVLYDLDNQYVRGQLALCAIFSGVNFQQAQGPFGSAPLQAIEMPLSDHYDLPHGRAKVMVVPAYLAYLADVLPRRLAKLARRCFGVTEVDDNKAATMLSGEVTRWFKSTHSFLTLTDVGIHEDKFAQMADVVIEALPKKDMFDNANSQPLTKADIVEIYRLCR